MQAQSVRSASEADALLYVGMAFERHANKADDFAVVDTTGASEAQIAEIMEKYRSLTPALRRKTIVINETRVLSD